MSRLLAPTLGVSLLAVLVGCGGGGSPSFGDGTTGTIPTNPSDGSGTTMRAAEGTYAVVLAGTNDAKTPTNYAGTGSATVASDGTVTIRGLEVTASGGTTGTATRVVVAGVTTTGAVSGTVTVGSGTPVAFTGAAAYQTNGTYLLTVSSKSGDVTTTDKYTLTVTAPVASEYRVSSTGTDDQRATYSGTGTATIGSAGELKAEYTSNRKLSGTTFGQTNTISSAVLKFDYTLSGTLAIQTGQYGTNSAPLTGTWSLSSANVLTLRVTYVNPTYFNGSGKNPTVTETLTLVKQDEE